MPRYFIIRQETGDPVVTPELYREIQAGRLRQGWGVTGLDLRQGLESYSRSYIDAWGQADLTEEMRIARETEGRARFAILHPMLDIVPGDRIVVPKQPRWDRFLILLAEPVDGHVYIFDDGKRQRDNPLEDDFRHVIHTNPTRLSEFGYHDNIDTLIVNRKMRAYQAAVNNVWNPELQQAIEHLLEGVRGGAVIPQTPPGDDTGPAEVVRRAALEKAVAQVLETLRTVAPHILEKIVEDIFERQGFETIARNRFTGGGGDIDRVFHWLAEGHPLLERLSPDLELGLTLNVQVKQKSGIDLDDVHGAKQLLAMRSGAINEYSILISTADTFTPECVMFAQREKVILVDGKAFAELYLKFV
jgi:hypothetical protein